MNHLIPLNEAKEMTALYRANREKILSTDQQGKDILANCETFDAEAIQSVLKQEGCVKFRIYYGMKADLQVHAIMVGVNAADEDIIAPGEAKLMSDPIIIEEGIRCPPQCPPGSPLNS